MFFGRTSIQHRFAGFVIYLMRTIFVVKSWVSTCFVFTVALWASSEASWAQVASPSDSVLSSLPRAPGRKLAEGVLTVVPPDQNSEDTSLGPYDLDFVKDHPELEWTPPDFPDNKPFYASSAETLLARSRDITFRHEVWALEFAFKPARLIEVDFPTETGGVTRKVVWYLVYRIRYSGQDLVPTLEENQEDVPVAPQKVRFESVRFLPRFAMVSKERGFSKDAQVLPAAKAAIEARERIGKPLYDQVEITKKEVLLSSLEADHSLWGVATWTNVDPRTDFFAIDVRGLTNAYKIRFDSEGKKNFDRKTLRIYFWRPGDVLDVTQDRIHLGLPAIENRSRLEYYLNQFNLKERLDYQWIYR